MPFVRRHIDTFPETGLSARTPAKSDSDRGVYESQEILFMQEAVEKLKALLGKNRSEIARKERDLESHKSKIEELASQSLGIDLAITELQQPKLIIDTSLNGE
jgi:hypothetical protein